MKAITIYGETREVAGELTVDGKRYDVIATGFKRIRFLLVGQRGNVLDLIADNGGRMVATDKSGRRQFGRTIFIEQDGLPVVSRKWEAA